MSLTRKRDLILFNLGIDEFSWRGVGLLAFVYIGSLFFAALVTGPVFSFFQWLDSVTTNGTIHYLADHSYERFFDRLRMVPVVLGVFWLFIQLRLFSWSKLGVRFNNIHRNLFLRWFLIGGGLLFLVMIPQLLVADVSLRENAVGLRWLSVPLFALLGALAVSFFEEVVFRGFTFRIFYTAFRPLLGILFSSAFFAYVHFKAPKIVDTGAGDLSWFTGFEVGFWMLFGITQNFSALEFFNLLVLGCLLCLLYLRTQSLLACMGLHAGAVFVRLSYIKLCEIPNHGTQWWWGGGKVIDGVYPLLLMLGLCFYLFYYGRGSRE